MSGRTAVALCLAAAFFFSTASACWEWMNAAPSPIQGTRDDGWLVDPNG